MYAEFTSGSDREEAVCVGADLTLDWTYDLASLNLMGLQWTFVRQGPSGAPTDIMSQMFYEPEPQPAAGYVGRILPGASSGGMVLQDVRISDTGVYTCTVLSREAFSMSSEVKVTITGTQHRPTGYVYGYYER